MRLSAGVLEDVFLGDLGCGQRPPESVFVGDVPFVGGIELRGEDLDHRASACVTPRLSHLRLRRLLRHLDSGTRLDGVPVSLTVTFGLQRDAVLGAQWPPTTPIYAGDGR